MYRYMESGGAAVMSDSASAHFQGLWSGLRLAGCAGAGLRLSGCPLVSRWRAAWLSPHAAEFHQMANCSLDHMQPPNLTL